MFVTRGQAGMFLAVGGINSFGTYCLADISFTAADDQTLLGTFAVTSHRVGPSGLPGVRHEEKIDDIVGSHV